MRRGALLLVPVTLGACVLHFGVDPKEVPLATRAAGTSGTVHAHTQSIAGELLAVYDSALMVATPGRVVQVQRSGVTHLQFDEWQRGLRSAPFTEHQWNQLRLLSRWPYGVADTALKQLLVKRRQPHVVVIDR